MPQVEKIVVGLAVRNEEKSLFSCLESVRKAMIFSKEPHMHLVVCLNGCTDNSELEAKKFGEKYSDIPYNIIESEEGLVNAQRTIVKSFPADIYIFPDADNVIEVSSIKLLLDTLRNNKNLKVVYAKTIPMPIPDKNCSLFYKIGLLYDSRALLTKRFYFHGRLFATREWRFPSNEEILKRAKSKKADSFLLKYIKGSTALFADDVWMSAYFIHKYGLDSIAQVNEAVCYSWPVGSLKDWFNVYRRINIEKEKIFRWFPEYRPLKKYLTRRTDWFKWLKADLGGKLLWLIFLLMKGCFYLWLRAEFLLARLPFYFPKDQWLVAKSTKNAFKK
jgi:glycosyltransferase involved in cell wall biosynthesis